MVEFHGHTSSGFRDLRGAVYQSSNASKPLKEQMPFNVKTITKTIFTAYDAFSANFLSLEGWVLAPDAINRYWFTVKWGEGM